MNLKRISAILCALFVLTLRSTAQAPTYYFNVTADTATESNATVIAGYVKTDIAPSAIDSVLIVLTSGAPRPSHMDASPQYVIYFSAGQDSVPFLIQLHDDTFPEYSEHLDYTLEGFGTIDTIGANNVLHFVLLDNDLPATISFITDSGWTWKDRDTFVNGAYLPNASPFYIGITVNNPNLFYIRYVADNRDCSRTGAAGSGAHRHGR